MSAHAPPTPKRRAAHHSPTPPPKATRMSASAPVFNPSKPLPAGSAGPSRNGAGGGGGDDHGDEPAPDAEEDMSAITAAAVASSRVTRPLPNSRRLAPGADFVPKAAMVPKSTDQKENTRRLIVVLSQVSPALSTYASSSFSVRLRRGCERGSIRRRINLDMAALQQENCTDTPVGMFGSLQGIFREWGQKFDG